MRALALLFRIYCGTLGNLTGSVLQTWVRLKVVTSHNY